MRESQNRQHRIYGRIDDRAKAPTVKPLPGAHTVRRPLELPKAKPLREQAMPVPRENNKKQQVRSNGIFLASVSRVFIFILRGLWGVLTALVHFIFKKRNGTRRFSVGGLIKRLFKWGVIAGVLLFITGGVYVLWISRQLPDPDRLASPDREISQSTIIYDRTGKETLYEIFNEKRRTLVELEDIPEYAVQATIAVEDKFFFEHKGVRWISVARAFVSNILGRREGAGGASTLTQQLIKNAIVGDERKITRKIKEAILATRLEKKYTKDQILKLYFNEIPYGSTNYGIAAASQSYFGKPVQDINLSEAAILAALPKAPSRYLNDFEALKGRRDFVLGLMVEQGYITGEQAAEAKKEPVALRKVIGNIKAPHFALYIRELVAEQYGERMLETGGLRVYTTLDYKLQQIAEEEVKKGVEEREEVQHIGNGALVAIDPGSGEILAMVGSRDFFSASKPEGCTSGSTCTFEPYVNVALRPRQPGSSLKPFIYTAGFEKGYTPDTILYDVVTNFDATNKKPYIPHNYDQSEHGPIRVHNALQISLNIPAVKMTYLVGVQPVIDFLERFGYSTFKDRSRFGLSIVLGGGEVTLLDHTAGYAALAAEGVYRKPVAILRIEDSKGTILFEQKPQQGEEVVDKEHVRTLTSILTDDDARAPLFGRGSVLTLPGRPVAAKTGTTNDYRDGWLMGYTPSLAAGVWVGNNNNEVMNKAGGSLGAGPIWNAFMRRALGGTPVEQFTPPQPIDTEKPVLRGTAEGGVRVLIDSVSGKLATSSTPPEFRKEKTFVQPHSILHYVMKDNPRGPTPVDPSVDPQYDLWEKAIQEWFIKKQTEGVEFDFSELPTEYDDVHDVALSPSVRIVEPSDGAMITDRQLTARVETSAPRGVLRVTYDVDGKFVFENKTFPFSLSWRGRDLADGKHTLTAHAYDDVGNTSSTSIKFRLNALPDPPDVVWKNPRYNASLFSSVFPLEFSLGFFRPEALVEIEFFAQPEGGERFSLGTLDQFGETSSFVWKTTPAPGTYSIIPVILDGTGARHEGMVWKIRVR